MSNPNHEEELYAQAAAELEDGNRDEGLWAKCFAECDGDRNKARAHYLKTRVARLTANENRLATGPPSESAKPPVIDSSEIADSFHDEHPKPIDEAEQRGGFMAFLGRWASVIGGVVIFLIVMGVSGAIGKECGGAAFESMSGGREAVDFNEKLRHVSDTMNRDLPKRIGGMTFDSTNTEFDRIIHYYYTVLESHRGRFDNRGQESTLLMEYRSNSSLQSFRDNGVTMVWHYRDERGVEFFQFKAAPEDL